MMATGLTPQGSPLANLPRNKMSRRPLSTMETGRPRFEPSEEQRRQVLLLAGLGIKQDEIANLLDVAPKTLRKAFRRELTTGMTEANARVVNALYANATKFNNVAAQIWWTKARMGWKEAQDLNVAGDGKLQVDFRWAGEPAAAPTKPAREAPTIDAAAEDTGGDLVVWQGEE